MDAHEAMYRSGQISGSQWERLKAQKGKAQNTRMANFDDRGGVRDQGGRHDRGVSEAGRSHIDKKQAMASGVKGVDGAPSKGGQVHGGQKQPVKRAEIDERAVQKPDFPAGARMKKSNAKGALRKGRIPARGGEYGGGGQQTQ